MWRRYHLWGRDTIYGAGIVCVYINEARIPFNNHEMWPGYHLRNLFLEQVWPRYHLGGRDTHNVARIPFSVAEIPLAYTRVWPGYHLGGRDTI